MNDIFAELWSYAKNSNDPSTWNAAMLVSESGHTVQGFNHIPYRTSQQVSAMGRDSKIQQIVHAEEGAIIEAARNGVSTRNATLYGLWVACPHCANVIVASGVRRVIGSDLLHRMTPPRWQSMVSAGIGKMVEAGIAVDWYKEPIQMRKPTPILFSGKILWPK